MDRADSSLVPNTSMTAVQLKNQELKEDLVFFLLVQRISYTGATLGTSRVIVETSIVSSTGFARYS